ncbi:hypothetical protein D3H65_06860 [Paraflavitalea soli]|uniref:Uncharacterized protein n=1 Tax=Paraflavitalea soli TaxID=2315862 RepID=A0A3B7MH48_9BACT|nr:HEPN domain-containing protein [Paraflavitalea soli]AXY73714.1 hypothetical protein D3H65_06860 [Paraflavitalea soli]
MKLESKYLQKLNECNPNELHIIISDFYNWAIQSDKKEIVYGSGQELGSSPALRLVYSNAGKVLSFEYEDLVIMKKIINSVETNLLAHVSKFSSEIVFTSVLLKDRYIRYRNVALLRPVAEKNELCINRNCPAILEFSYLGSSHERVDGDRRNRKLAEILWFMNTVLIITIKIANTSGGEHYGTVSRSRLGEFHSPNNVLFFKRYSTILPERILDKLDYRELDHDIIFEKLAIFPEGSVDNATYYSTMIYEDYSLYTPECMHFAMDKFISMENENLINSTYWFNQAILKEDGDLYSCIIALATSLECLIDKTSEKCKECGQEKFSIKKKVLTLVKDYSGDLTKGNDSITNMIGYFYDIRSDIVHGKALPLVGIPNQRDFDPIINSTTFRINHFIFIVRIVILNFCLDKHLTKEISHMRRLV